MYLTSMQARSALSSPSNGRTVMGSGASITYLQTKTNHSSIAKEECDMRVELQTASRDLVSRYVIPDMIPVPDVIIWGSRVFHLEGDEADCDEDVFVYRQSFTYTIAEAPPTWEPSADTKAEP
jgi:hypothetical protein